MPIRALSDLIGRFINPIHYIFTFHLWKLIVVELKWSPFHMGIWVTLKIEPFLENVRWNAWFWVETPSGLQPESGIVLNAIALYKKLHQNV